MAIELDARKIVADQMSLTVNIKNYSQLRFRFWLGFQFIRLAAWIMWIDNIDVQLND